MSEKYGTISKNNVVTIFSHFLQFELLSRELYYWEILCEDYRCTILLADDELDGFMLFDDKHYEDASEHVFRIQLLPAALNPTEF